jgi:hypothetical protein
MEPAILGSDLADGGWPLKRYSRNLLVIFFVVSLAVMPLLFWLRDIGFFMVPEEAPDHYLVAISLYNGFALAGLVVLIRFIKKEAQFLKRVAGLVMVLIVSTIIRIYIADLYPDVGYVIGSVLWESARVVCVAFAVAYLAHAMMVRYLPSTLVRIRDITPILTDGRMVREDPHRLKHAKRSRWIFDMGSREHLDTTNLRLETQDVRGFSWKDWGIVSLWAAIGLTALSIYAEAYPRVEERFDIVFTAVISAHILSIIPILVLPMLPIKALGPSITVGGREFDLAKGFAVNLTRWLKIAFFPIIAVGLLVRDLSWENVVELMQALLITIPTAMITCMVYIYCFRERTVGEIHRGIKLREGLDNQLFEPEPWRETSLLEGVEIVESDIYLE